MLSHDTFVLDNTSFGSYLMLYMFKRCTRHMSPTICWITNSMVNRIFFSITSLDFLYAYIDCGLIQVCNFCKIRSWRKMLVGEFVIR